MLRTAAATGTAKRKETGNDPPRRYPGCGVGGLELSTILSEALGDRLDITLIDRNESFVFGFSKLDIMFGREPPGAVRFSYRNIVKPGVVFRQETITVIDPEARRVTTDHGTYEADVLVIALGADYDLAATPGLIEGGHEFYSFAGAERLREVLATFRSGHAIVGVTAAPFKCPPAPSEAALLLHDHASGAWTWTFFRGRRPRGASADHRSPWPLRSGNSAPVAGPAGSDADAASQARALWVIDHFSML